MKTITFLPNEPQTLCLKEVSGILDGFHVIYEITATVTELLKESGEQWNDQAKQDAICTVFISAAKAGGIVFDFPSEAA